MLISTQNHANSQIHRKMRYVYSEKMVEALRFLRWSYSSQTWLYNKTESASVSCSDLSTASIPFLCHHFTGLNFLFFSLIDLLQRTQKYTWRISSRLLKTLCLQLLLLMPSYMMAINVELIIKLAVFISGFKEHNISH